ncbi:hypothetical protein CCZ01_09985, partial [Helicobacter monodelphidis]
MDNQPTGHEANFTSESVFEHKASNVLPQNQQPNYTTNLINNIDFTAKYAKFKKQFFAEVRQSVENEIKQSAKMSEFYLQRLLNSSDDEFFDNLEFNTFKEHFSVSLEKKINDAIIQENRNEFLKDIQANIS